MLNLKDILHFTDDRKRKTVIIPPEYICKDRFFHTLVADFFEKEGIDRTNADLLKLSVTVDDSLNDTHSLPEIYFRGRITYFDKEEFINKTAEFPIEEMPFEYYNDLMERFRIINEPVNGQKTEEEKPYEEEKEEDIDKDRLFDNIMEYAASIESDFEYDSYF